jgi:hypothetical protein
MYIINMSSDQPDVKDSVREANGEIVYGKVIVKPRTPRNIRGEVVLLENSALKAELERRLKRAAKYIKPRDGLYTHYLENAQKFI